MHDPNRTRHDFMIHLLPRRLPLGHLPATERSLQQSSSEPRRDTVRREPWHTPILEPLGTWRAVTLQQSIPIGPGSAMLMPHDDVGRRLT